MGVWDRIFAAVSAAYEGSAMVDSSSIRVHQHGANAKRGRTSTAAEGLSLPARCMGRSRGGLTTKIHALADARGLPIALKLTQGQAHDGRRRRGHARPLAAGQTLLADAPMTAIASGPCRAWRLGRIKPIPRRTTPPAVDRTSTDDRNLIDGSSANQTLPRHRDPLREARRQLSRPHQTRCRAHLDALYELVT